tara:strand:+ start:1607 stop:2296 length:690 start_codon:yes stop_codon:yes gene_type:complete
MGGCGCNKGQKASKLFKDCGCGCKGKKQEHKFIISVMSALIFFVVANPETFRAMRRLVGGWVSSPTGCPTIKGLALHTVVFMLVVWGLMNIRKEGEEMAPPEEQMTPPAIPEAPEAPEAPATPATPAPPATPPPPAAPKASAAPTMSAPGVNNTKNLGSDEDIVENTLAPYSPIDSGNPSIQEMASTATGGMSSKLGGSVSTTQPQEALKTGDYMQCKCGDGSHVMLMK